jgi:hypothetical protein
VTNLFVSRARIAIAILVWLSGAGTARAEWVISAYLGSAHTLSAPLTIVQPMPGTDVRLEPVDYRGDSFRSPLYYGYRLTWFPQRIAWLGVETEFVHLKAYAQTDRLTHGFGRHHGIPVDGPVVVNDIVERFSISHGLNFLLFNAVVRHRFRGGFSRFEVGGRIGAGPTIPHAESTIDGRSREGYSWGAPGWQAAGSVEVRLASRIDLIGEYKFSRARESVDVDRGTARGVFASHHVIAGLSWHTSTPEPRQR